MFILPALLSQKGMAFDEANEALVGDESPNKRSSSSGGPSPKRRAGVSSSTPRNQRFATALRSLGSPASSPSSPMTPGNGSDSSLTPTNGEQSSTMPTPSGSRGSTPTPLPSASAASATPASSTLVCINQCDMFCVFVYRLPLGMLVHSVDCTVLHCTVVVNVILKKFQVSVHTSSAAPYLICCIHATWLQL